jgi:predicted  nucleic acid-binding Zn-ribbon protein
MSTPKKNTELQELPVEQKLKQLYELQCIDSKIDALMVMRGELPLEVKDLEKACADVVAQLKACDAEVAELDGLINQERNNIKTSTFLIEKYKKQIDGVRNNREHESLSKEIEFQMLEIELCEKKIKEHGVSIEIKRRDKNDLNKVLVEKQKTFAVKQGALEEITAETKKEVDELKKQTTVSRRTIEDRLLAVYDRLRGSFRNGLAVVLVKRGACGGCFNKIPPQRQVDIKLNKKVAFCEYCGRFLVSIDLVTDAQQ